MKMQSSGSTIGGGCGDGASVTVPLSVPWVDKNSTPRIPDCIFIAGEITTAWDLVESTVRTALAERALTPAACSTDIVVVSAEEHPRLRGAAMLVAAPTFAAPVVA